MLRRPTILAALALATFAAAPAGVVPANHVPPARATSTRNARPQAAAASVATYHNDYYRSGQYVVPGLTLHRAAAMHMDKAFTGTITGNVYAQPLYWNGTTGNGIVIVATESNHVTALDALTGRVVWDRPLGAPVQGGVLPCGNISPEGITGTPVIDPASGSLYVTATEAVGNGGAVSVIDGISLATGRSLPGWPIQVDAALKHIGFTAMWQGERGALAIVGSRLYVPYGGRYGDCDNYRGTVVSVDLVHPRVLGAWRTLAVRGGIWAVGGVAEADGSLFATTGNTSGASHWSGGEAIIRLEPAFATSTTPADYFTPANWETLDNDDLDLGGTGPMPVDVGGRKLVVNLGKDGNAYLADRTHLGGVGGQLAYTAFSNQQTTGSGASWVDGGAAFVAYATAGSSPKCGSRQGLTVARVTGGAKPTIATVWCATLDGAGSPVVTTSNGTADRIVWATGAEGDNLLHGYDAAGGAVVFGGGNQSMQNLRHMTTILVAHGRIYVASDNRVYAFVP